MVTTAADPGSPAPDVIGANTASEMSAVTARAKIFHYVDPAVAAELTTQLPSVRFARHAQIFTEGAPGDRLYIVISGKVKIGRAHPDGRGHLLAIAGPFDIIGELSMVDPGPRSATATALTEVHAAAVERHTFRAWIAEHPHIAERLLQLMARRLRRTHSEISDLTFTDTPPGSPNTCSS